MFVSVVLVNIGVLHTTTTETFYWNLIHHVSCLFKIVRQQISELDGIENKNKFQEKLSFIVEIHEVAFRQVLEDYLTQHKLQFFFYIKEVADVWKRPSSPCWAICTPHVSCRSAT